MTIDKNRCNLLPIRFPIGNLKEGLPQMFTQKLPSMSAQFTNATLTVQILFLVLFARIITREELLYYFNPNNPKALIAVIDRLTRSNHLMSVPLGEGPACIDSRSRSGLCLSANGHKLVCHAFNLSIKYKPIDTPKYNLHTYSLGMNFLSILTNPFIPRAKNISLDYELDNVDRRADAMYTINGKNIYVEQDMLNESTKVLLNKLEDYENGIGYNGSNITVLLSFRTPRIQIAPIGAQRKNPRYNQRLLSIADEWANSTDAMLCGDLSLAGAVEEARVHGLPNRDLYALLMKDLVDHDMSILSENPYLLHKHISDLSNYCGSDFYHMEFNTIQEEQMAKRKNALIDYIISDCYSSEQHGKWMGFLSGQFEVYCVPTNRLSHDMPYIIYYENSCVRKTLENTLKRLIPHIDFSSYEKELHLDINYSEWNKNDTKWINIWPRNHYRAGQRDVFVENLADIGAHVRITALFDCVRESDIDSRIIIVALVASEREALYFSEKYKTKRFHNPSVGIMFLNVANSFVRKDLVADNSSMGLIYVNSDRNWMQADDLYQYGDKAIYLNKNGKIQQI